MEPAPEAGWRYSARAARSRDGPGARRSYTVTRRPRACSSATTSKSSRSTAYFTTSRREVPTGSPLAEYFCLSLEEESPHGLARIYLPRDLAPVGVLDEDFAGQEAVTRFAVLGPPPAAVREMVCARPATPDESAALRISPTAVVLAITRIATDSTGRVVEAALLAFPRDRVDAVFTTHHVIDERQTQA
ncbi:hypothetical protein KE639_03140 [Streptomyces sp. V17-9]|nr:hypothetical protein KE639_03140 [Streptomyces sp. V17-9]